MKSHLCLLVFLFFLITSTTHVHQVLGSEEEADPVRDFEGNIVRADTDYYISSSMRPRGGVTLAGSNGEVDCPPYVVQAPFFTNRGIPVTFTPVNPKKGVIRLSTDLNIKFSIDDVCNETTVWKVKDDIKFITLGGVIGHPGPGTYSNWFKIEKDDDFYKLVFCPSVCPFCPVICKDIGIYYEDEELRLALGGSYFGVQFAKVGSVLAIN